MSRRGVGGWNNSLVYPKTACKMVEMVTSANPVSPVVLQSRWFIFTCGVPTTSATTPRLLARPESTRLQMLFITRSFAEQTSPRSHILQLNIVHTYGPSSPTSRINKGDDGLDLKQRQLEVRSGTQCGAAYRPNRYYPTALHANSVHSQKSHGCFMRDMTEEINM